MMKRRITDHRLNLSSNELLHPDAEPVLALVLAALSPSALRCYPAAMEVITEIAEYFNVNNEALLLTPGSDAAIRLIIDHYVKQRASKDNGNGKLILQHPNYNAWEQAASLQGLAVHTVTAPIADSEEQGRRLIQAAQDTSGGLIAVSVPSSPIGGCLPLSQLDQLTEIACRQGHLLVIDSCYQAFCGELTAQIQRRGGPVLVVQTLSKSHGLAGARVALVCAEPAAIASLAAGQIEQTVSGPSLLAAGMVCRRHKTFCSIWAEIKAVRDDIAQQLRAREIEALPSGGNFLTVRLGSAMSAKAVSASLSKAGYRVRDFSSLPEFADCLRFTIGDAPTAATVFTALCNAVCALTELAIH